MSDGECRTLPNAAERKSPHASTTLGMVRLTSSQNVQGEGSSEKIRPTSQAVIPTYLASKTAESLDGKNAWHQPEKHEVEDEKDVVTMTFPDGKVVELPLKKGQLGTERFIDIQTLYAKSGHFTYDPGCGNTATCSSAITYISGEDGICLYRGYPVKDLCENCEYLETCYLLLWGDIPSPTELAVFKSVVMSSSLVHEKFKKFFDGFPDQTHPMSIMVSACGALSGFFNDSLNIWEPADREITAMRIIGKLPTIAAMAYKTAIGEPIVYPRSDLTYAENFLHMMFASPLCHFEVNPVHAQALDKFLILHADHEQNASTSTVRIAGSSQANPFACMAAGIASLWGPAHGGANEAVIKMLSEIGSVDNIDQFLADVKAKKDGVRLMGFGHRVYKNFDPRARYMKILVQDVLNTLDCLDPDLELAMALEEKALSDEYFVKRKLYPNVDFYSGILLRAIGIPTAMYTVLFALGRSIGWICQWRELVSEKQMRIGRPRQIYVGVGERDVVSMKDVLAAADEADGGHHNTSSQMTEKLQCHNAAASNVPGSKMYGNMGRIANKYAST